MPKPRNPWDIAAKQPLARGNYLYLSPDPLEPGVRFFVRMLEKLECKTEWSCEGHPAGFHVVFHGPERIAREIVGIGVFSVSLWSHGGWVITIDGEDLANKRRQPWTERQHRKDLRLAATLWVSHFGELDDEGYPEMLVVEPRDRTAKAIRQLAIAVECFLADKNNTETEESLIYELMCAYTALAADPQTLTTQEPIT